MGDRIERHADLKTTPSRVWMALTDPEEFGEWFRVKLETPFLPGKAAHGHVTYPGAEHLVMSIVVQRMEAERLFSFTWHPAAVDPDVDYSQEPPTLVEFLLEPSLGGTRVTVTESGFSKLPASRRAEAFRVNAQGWGIQMRNLEAHLASEPAGR